MPIILSQNIIKKSDYDDIPYERYHFPKRYRKNISPGDLFIYHQGDKSNKNNRFYFGMGVIGAISPAEDEEHFYAEIIDGNAFDRRVSIYNDKTKYYELIEDDGKQRNSSPAWQWAIRKISKKAYESILIAAGIETNKDLTTKISDIKVRPNE